MTLKGNLEVLNLSDIFQSLSLNKHTGTLVVTDGKREKLIYFAEGEIALFSSDRRLRIGDMLVSAGKLARQDLDYALTQQDELTGGANTRAIKLGHILIEEGFVTDDDVNDIVRGQIEEEIYDLFLWKQAEFEFLIDYCPEKLRRPSCNVTTLQFNTNSLIMEAVRRLDEWDLITTEIPSLKEVFRLTPLATPDQISRIDLPKHVRDETNLFDGQHTLEQIAELTAVSKFELCRLVYELKQGGLVESLSPEELSSLAEQLGKQGRWKQAAGLFERLTEVLPRNVSIRRSFAEALYAAGEVAPSIRQFEFLAGELEVKRSDRPQLAAAYRAILEIDPERKDIQERLTALNRSNPVRRAIRIAILVLVLAPLAIVVVMLIRKEDVGGLGPMVRELVAKWIPKKKDDGGDSIVDAETQKARDLYGEGRTLLAAGQPADAWKKLKAVVDLYGKTGPADLVTLPLVIRSTPPGMQVRINGEARGTTPATVTYVPGLDVLELELRDPTGSVSLWAEERAADAFHEIDVDLTREPSWSFATGDEGTGRAGGPIRSRPTIYRGVAYTAGLDGYAYGVRLADRTKVFQARLRPAPLDATAERVSPPILSGSWLAMGTQDGEILSYDLVRRVERGRVPFGSDQALVAPVELTDGEVAFGGRGGEIGLYALPTNKLLHKVAAFQHRVSALVGAGHDVFATSRDNRVAAYRAEKGQLELRWSRDLGADIEAAPAVYEHLVLVGTVDGRVIALSREDGETVWGPLDFTSAVVGFGVSRGVGVAATADGRLRGFDLATGRVDWTTQIEGLPHPPHAIGRVAYVATRAGEVFAFDLVASGALLWSGRTGSRCLGGPVAEEGHLLLGCEDGRLYMFDLR